MLMIDPQIILCSVVDQSAGGVRRRFVPIIVHCLFVNRRSTSRSYRGVYIREGLRFSLPGLLSVLSWAAKPPFNQTRPNPFTTRTCLALRKPKPPPLPAPKKTPNHTIVPLLPLPHLQERRARLGQRPTRSSCFSKSSGRKSRIST